MRKGIIAGAVSAVDSCADVTWDDLARAGARRMIGIALGVEVEADVRYRDERDARTLPVLLGPPAAGLSPSTITPVQA